MTSTRRNEDKVLAWSLFFVGVGSLFASAPYFVAMWRALSAATPGSLPSTGVLFAIELAKVVTLSGLAAWSGYRSATYAGLDEPVIRAVVRRDAGGAVRAFVACVPIGLALGVVASLLEISLWHFLSGEPLSATFALSKRGVTSPLARATAVAYGSIGIELWFRWGVVPAVMTAALRRGVTRGRAFWIGNVAAAMIFGIFVIPSALGAPPYLHSPARLAFAGFASYGTSSLVYGVGLRRSGLTAAATGHGVTTAVRVLLCPWLVAP